MTTLLSIVIVNWNTEHLLQVCLSSLVGEITVPAEIVVVDNGSSDKSVLMLRREFPIVRAIENAKNCGFARANNQGIASTTGPYVLLLNSDTVVQPGAIETLVAFLDQHPDAAAVSPRLLRPDGSSQPFAFGCDPTFGYLIRRAVSSVLLKRPLHDWSTNAVQEMDWVSGACMLVRRKAIDQTGMLDEGFFMYFEDNDWCVRFRRGGWRIFFVPSAEIVHVGGQSIKQKGDLTNIYYASLKRFYAKHYGRAAQWGLACLLLPYRWMQPRGSTT